MNAPVATFDEETQGSNHLVFIYVFDSQQEKSKQMSENIIAPTAKELKGYLKFYAFDCRNTEVKSSGRFTMCDNEEYTPFF